MRGGRVEKVGKDVLDEPTVLLRGRNEFESVVFSFADQSHLSELSRRQMVRICGEGVGSFIGRSVVENARLTAMKA